MNDHHQQRIRTAEPAFHNISEKLLSFELGMLLLDLDVDAAQYGCDLCRVLSENYSEELIDWVENEFHKGSCQRLPRFGGVMSCPLLSLGVEVAVSPQLSLKLFGIHTKPF